MWLADGRGMGLDGWACMMYSRGVVEVSEEGRLEGVRFAICACGEECVVRFFSQRVSLCAWQICTFQQKVS